MRLSIDTSYSIMETQREAQKPTNNNGQLIFVPHNDTIRLLEVYVKRSLSLNEGSPACKQTEKREKWVTKRHRRHSSDPSIHLAEGLNDEEIGPFAAIEPSPEEPSTIPEEKENEREKEETEETEKETETEKEKEKEEKPRKKIKKLKKKKPSLWKSFLSLFSQKDSDDKDDEQDSPSDTPDPGHGEDEAFDTPAQCLPSIPAPAPKPKSMRRRSIRKRLSKRRLSFIKPSKPGKDLNSADITGVEAVVSVEPTYSYYEKVTEELEKIVHEVKEKEEVKSLTDEEVINRIIALTKEEGDAIDGKLKDNPTLSCFFQQMTYSSFQKLADAYLEKEASPTQNPPTILPTAPELVKLAFTLDFTARIAGLSKQNIGHITGLGNRYLQDRFEYKQACSDHPWPDSDD